VLSERTADCLAQHRRDAFSSRIWIHQGWDSPGVWVRVGRNHCDVCRYDRGWGLNMEVVKDRGWLSTRKKGIKNSHQNYQREDCEAVFSGHFPLGVASEVVIPWDPKGVASFPCYWPVSCPESDFHCWHNIQRNGLRGYGLEHRARRVLLGAIARSASPDGQVF
jgi:hypothetical protein